MKDKMELFKGYIKANVAPILTDFIKGDDIPDATLLPATISLEELNGHYEEDKFVPSKWYNDLLNSDKKILVIDKLDSIDKNSQRKFMDILKYKKVYTFELPKDCVIIITADSINANSINEEIYSLVAHI